ncbi:hypothetical protein Pint_21669 [Pistacia integerrima]|uniref:Uncharacterized protein n=2 Tax=Pistacia integerrima TaxID=434235 RepID=A0ACC0XAL2_9ROSI|nr:hypothetical protein Pint_21669 [Pistacia integerrima]
MENARCFDRFCGVSQSILKQLPSCPIWYRCKGQAILTTFNKLLITGFNLATVPEIINQIKCFDGCSITGGDTFLFLFFGFISYVVLTELYISSTGSLLTSAFVKMPKTAWVSGLIQTALYADFFYYHFKSWKNRKQLKQPACVDQVLFH